MCLVWGSTWLAIKLGLENLSPFLFAGMRFFIAALALGAFIKLRKRSLKLNKGELIPFIILSLTSTSLSYGLVFWAEQYVDSAMGSIIMCTHPMFVFILSFVMKSHERPRGYQFLGIMLGMIGVFFIFLPKIQFGLADLKGEIALLASSIIYSISSVYYKKHGFKFDIYKCVFYQFALGFPLLIVVGLIFESPYALAMDLTNIKVWIPLLYLAFFGSVIALIILYYLITKIGAVPSSFSMFITVCIAILLDWLVMDVIPAKYTGLGIILIFTGVWLTSFYKKIPSPPLAGEG